MSRFLLKGWERITLQRLMDDVVGESRCLLNPTTSSGLGAKKIVGWKVCELRWENEEDVV